jgi:hypothetical protein
MKDLEFTCVCCGDPVGEDDEICVECRVVRAEAQEAENVAELELDED